MPVRIIATSFAFIAFAVALVCGLAADNPTTTIFTRAIFAMIICYIVGIVVGTIGKHAIQEHVDKYKEEHPVRPEGAEEDDDVEVINEEDLVGEVEHEDSASSNATTAVAS